MCQFDPSVASDRANYELVQGNMDELCKKASQLGETNQSTTHTTQEQISNPEPLTENTTFPSVPTSSDEDLESRVEALRR